MSWASDERIASDTAVAGRMVNDYISRDSSRRVDLDEALESSRYTSHPYSSPPKEVRFYENADSSEFASIGFALPLKIYTFSVSLLTPSVCYVSVILRHSIFACSLVILVSRVVTWECVLAVLCRFAFSYLEGSIS